MDAELEIRVRQAQAGQRAAVEWLLEREQQRIFAIAYHFLGPSEAEDAAQEALIKIFSKLGQLRQPQQFRSWSGRVAANLCRDRLRSRAPVAEPLDLIGDLPSPDDVTGQPDLRAQLAGALQTLTPTLRLPVLLRDVEQLSCEEVAEALEIPVGTVKSRLHEARKKLRAWLTRQGVSCR